MQLLRREFLKVAGVAAAGLALSPSFVHAQPLRVEEFELPPLPYDYDALEPVIDRTTMEIHHGRHHQGYVNNLNRALKGVPVAETVTLERLLSDLEQLPEEVRTAVRNNGGGHYNHSLFWKAMISPEQRELKAPEGELFQAIGAEFGDFETFKTRFQEAGGSRFGSGWVWLAWDPKCERLKVTSTPNQDNPIMDGLQPLLGNDVWEHAYYLNYQNRRADYLSAWWDVVNWPVVQERFQTVQ